MASATLLSSTASASPFRPQSFSKFPSPALLSFCHSLRPFLPSSRPLTLQQRRANLTATVKAQIFDFEVSSNDGELDEDDDPLFPGWGSINVEEKETPPCPPGLRQYETMAVLRPDMSEDERLALTQKYEEVLVAGGGMYVEVFNRGVIPLAYSIRKKNREGETNTYMDGIYLLFTYFTKPESMQVLETTLKTDDDVIRSSSFKINERKIIVKDN